MQEFQLNTNWKVFQDVKDKGEKFGVFTPGWTAKATPTEAFSDWEPIDRLAHLQLLLAPNPYYGRSLRSFNNAPWWYKNEFLVPEETKEKRSVLRFEGVDYFSKIWLNGHFLGEHEGYFAAFDFDVSDKLNYGGSNTLVVKVWSPWDTTIIPLKSDGMEVDIGAHDMMKGTYEHSDGFIQRDVNPVGIWNDVRLMLYSGVSIDGDVLIETECTDDNARANVSAKASLVSKEDRDVLVRCAVVDKSTGTTVASAENAYHVPAGGAEQTIALTVPNPKIWNTWDRGEPNLYSMRVEIVQEDGSIEAAQSTFGIRKIEIRRTEKETAFILNNKDIFLRGTSYFPDVYISKMTKERYLRDMQALKSAGFNVVRVHVHVAKKELYDICDELGIAVFQDSDLNWVHPNTPEFKDCAVKIFGDMLSKLRIHPSIICWICMNEPDIWMIALERGMVKAFDPMPTSMMNETPGPQLVAELKRLDPSRPYIKGSRYANDPESGDSHMYLGSLSGEHTRYTDVFDVQEKLNTEFGFDAPGTAGNLREFPEIFKRLQSLIEETDGIAELQYYQYRLLKYYIEHYRIMKYRPCSGYFQFLLTDIGPQSFYGVYDWWGDPKLGLKALEESNLPIGVFMEYKDEPIALWVVNDLLESYTGCTVEWTVTFGKAETLLTGSKEVDIGEDCTIRLCDFNFAVQEDVCYDVCLQVLDASGRILSRNNYQNAFQHPAHPKGHPGDMCHELGMRVFGT